MLQYQVVISIICVDTGLMLLGKQFCTLRWLYNAMRHVLVAQALEL
jgi:hypothetical protein